MLVRDRPRSRPASIWSHREWRIPFPASVFSRFCTVIYDLTIILWIGADVMADDKWGPAAVSGAVIAAAVPVLFVGPIAGVIVDRCDRRRILILSNCAEVAAAGAAFSLTFFWESLPRLGVLVWIYTCVVVLNSAAQFFGQARVVMISKTVPRELQTKAFSLLGTVSSLANIIGPPLAAPLLFSVGIGWALGINAVSFMVSAVAFGLVRWDSRPSPGSSNVAFLQSLKQGVATVRGSRLLVALLVAVSISTLVLGTTEVLEIYFVQDSLGERAGMLGILMMSLALGTLLGTAVAPRVSKHVSMPVVFVNALLAVGALLFIFSRSTNFFVACVLEFALAVPIGLVNTLFMPMMIKSVDESVLGRAVSAFNVFPTAANLVSMAGAGVLLSTVLSGVHFEFWIWTVHPVDFVYSIAGIALIVIALAVRRPVLHAGVES